MITNDCKRPYFHQRLKHLRKSVNKMTQVELAEKAGVPVRSISKFELGLSVPSYWTIYNLSKALGTTSDYLLGLCDKPFWLFLKLSKEDLYKNMLKLSEKDKSVVENMIKFIVNSYAEK